MIILLLGGIGSGKTLSVIKKIIDNPESFAVTNFSLKIEKERYCRLKMEDLICKRMEDKKNIQSVNWKFWDEMRKKHEHFSVYLDEVHNLIHSRASMSKRNILMSKWISQIRKILSDSPHNHLYIISQTIRKVDVDFRELAQIIIECRKRVYKGKTYIVQKYYTGIDEYFMRQHYCRMAFAADMYFKYYDTNEMVTFADADVYV